MSIKKAIVEPYRKRKPIINLNVLEKAYRIKRQYLFLAIVVISLLLFSRKYFIFAAMTLISAVFSFYHSRYNRTPIDLKLALFLGLLITRHYGIPFTVLFFIISDTIPSILGGGSIDGAAMVFIGWYFIVNLLVYLFPQISIVVIGPLLVIVEAIGSFFINSRFGIPGFMSFFVSILTIMVRIIYFLTLGGFMEAMLLAA